MAETAKAANDVQAEFDALRRDVSKLTEAVGHLLSESTDDVKARARATIQQGATAAQQAAGVAGTKVTDFVDERPATSLLIAFGAGLLFGSFFRRS